MESGSATGPLRQVPTSIRLALLAVVSGVAALTTDLRIVIAFAVLGGAVLAVSRPAWHRIATGAVGWLILVVAVAATHLLNHDPVAARLAVARLLAIVLWATAVTAATTTEELLSTVVWMAQPLRRFGVQPASVGLVVALTIRFIPELEAMMHRRREAHLARGLSPRAITMVAPMVVAALDRSQAMAEAIVARSFFDRGEEPR